MTKGQIIALVGAVTIGTAAFIADRTGAFPILKQTQIVEGDGHRQIEYKLLGFIPYEKQEVAPNLSVSPAVLQQIRNSIELPKGLHVEHASFIERIIRAKQPSLLLHAPFSGDPAAQLTFLKPRVRSVRMHNGGSYVQFDAICNDGSRLMLVFDQMVGSGPKTQAECLLQIIR